MINEAGRPAPARLIAAGHTAAQAEQVVSVLLRWQYAPSKGVDVFAAAGIRLWRETSNRDGAFWTGRMVCVPKEWL